MGFAFVAESFRRHPVVLHEHGAFVLPAETSARSPDPVPLAQWKTAARDIAASDALHRAERARRRFDRDVSPRPERRLRSKVLRFVFGRVSSPVETHPPTLVI